MIIQLIPFYYLTSKVASEKESKAKEGMKMMGLMDSTYYLAWFIFYSAISVLTAILVTIMSFGIFHKVNKFMYFVFCLVYALNLYG